MKITDELARHIALSVGDQNMDKAGRAEWSEEDAELATAVYNRLIQKMDTEVDDELES